jgi:hypothetical protein
MMRKLLNLGFESTVASDKKVAMNASSWLDSITPLFAYTSFFALAFCALGAWWLNQSKVVGGRWMMWGMMIQGVRLLDMIYNKINSLHLITGTYKQNYELTVIVLLVANVGLLIFAIGLFLHAKHQRGLQARVDELERILADVHSRER